MSRSETLLTFSSKFVNEAFRERFLHEATKRPEKLFTRICHDIGTVLSSKYRGGAVEFEPQDVCLMLGRKTSFEEATWSVANRMTGFGSGLLVISADGERFYAETEGAPKHEVWGGDA